MGSIKKGILGPVNGKVGTVVGSSWNGIDYIRSLPSRSKNSKLSPAQELQHAKFALVAGFTRVLKVILGITFKTVAKGMTGQKAAADQIIKNPDR